MDKMEELTKLFCNKLDVIKGVDDLSKNHVIGLYFSAHWCPPCKQFTPKLADAYTAIQNIDEHVLEIIFISSDENEIAFNGYSKAMPWKALPFAERDTKNHLSQHFGVRGIPTLVLLNTQGSILDMDGRSFIEKALMAHDWIKCKEDLLALKPIASKQ